MKILALEFSSRRRSVAVAESSHFRVLGSANEVNARGSNGMLLVDRALAEAGIAPAEIEVIAVGLGPGSYAGIRSAIAIAQGWQLAREVRLIGVNSAEVIAAQPQEQKIFGEMTIIIDAQRHEVYTARFEVSERQLTEIESLRIVAASALQAGGRIIGPDAEQLLQGAINVYPTAETLAGIAATRNDYRSGEELEPVYLRESSFVKASPPRFGT